MVKKAIGKKGANQILVYNERSIQLMEWMMSKGMYATKKEMMEDMGSHASYFNIIKSGRQSLTPAQILWLCQRTKASANWIFGLSDQMFTRSKDVSPLDMIKEAVKILEKKHAK